MIVDSHSHIFDEAFDADRQQVMDRAIGVDVQYQIMPNVDSSTIQRLCNVASQYSCCFPLMGLHPTSVTQNYADELSIVEHEFATGKYYGVGEIGIDLYWDKTFVNEQIEVFKCQLNWAKKSHLPVVVHVRNAYEEVFRVLDSEIDSDLSGVIHCFSGTLEQYNHIMEYKTFMVGIGGVVTYKNGAIDKFIDKMDLSRIIFETDSPYLSPVPVRGSRNEPSNIIHTVTKVADILGVTVADISQTASLNTVNLFKLPVKF